MEVEPHIFFTATPVEGEWAVSISSYFPPGKIQVPVYGKWVTPRAGYTA
jgi:hypothetical protein